MTLYARADANDLYREGGTARIRILADPVNGEEIDMVSYAADDDYGVAMANIRNALLACGYRIMGGPADDGNNTIIIPVLKGGQS